MPNYTLIRQACIAQAERYAGRTYARTMRRVATDCDYAAEGCAASAESVAETLAEDHELLMEVILASTQDDASLIEDEALACVRSTIGMAA